VPPLLRAFVACIRTAALSAALLCGTLHAQGLTPRTDADRVADLLSTARRLVAEGDAAAALTRLETIARRYRSAPGADEAALLAGQLLLANRELSDAFDEFQRVVDRHAASPLFTKAIEGQTEAARLALDAHRTALRRGDRPGPEIPDRDTIGVMFRQIVKNGRFTEAAPAQQYALAVALDQLALPDEATAELERFMRDYPDHPLADDAAFQIANIRYHQCSRSNRESGFLESALLGFETFLALHPESERGPEARARIALLQGWQRDKLLEAARHYERTGKREAAAMTLARVLQEFPDSPGAEDLALKARQLSSPAAQPPAQPPAQPVPSAQP
jgi:outer membrane protein assembly factor BamD (BamD/ComL family)